MKVVLPKNDGGKKKFNPPPLPLVDEEVSVEDKTKACKFKLRTEPSQAASPTYDFNMLKLDGSESLRHSLRFSRDVLKVFTGLDITTALC